MAVDVGNRRSLRNIFKSTKKQIKKSTKKGFLTPEMESILRDFSRLKKDDFANFYTPTDDPFGGTKSGGTTDGRPGLSDLEALSQRRVGVGWRITRVPSDDAVRNKFYFTDLNDKVVSRPKIEAWIVKTDFYNQLANCLYYERSYGVGFLIKYYGLRTAQEKKDGFEDLSKPVPKGIKVMRFKALPPTFMSPTNIYESRGVDYDEAVWKFQGGSIHPQRIHKSRVEVLITRPIAGDWRGISALEPIWLSLNAYYNSVIYLTKGISKWGNTVPVLSMGDSESNTEAFDKWVALMLEFQANYFYLIGKDDKLEFVNAALGQGITEYTEFLKEDISSGTTIPLNLLFGRSTSGGIGGEGALTSERFYMNMLSNIQMSITDNVFNIISESFDLSKNKISWNLAIQKTKEQRLREENMIVQNDTMLEQLKALKIQNKMSKLQLDMIKKNPDLLNQTKTDEEEVKKEESLESPPKKTTSDFSSNNSLYFNKIGEFIKQLKDTSDFAERILENNRKINE